MDSLPLVSILMPAKNASVHLKDCLDSIINQSYKNWELIIVDDHSMDSTPEIIHTYCLKDHRIKYLKNNGNGIIKALQTAYALSSGSYISRMDSDDLMSTHKLESLTKLLLAKGKGFIATGLVKYISNDQLGEGYKKYEQWLNSLTVKAENFNDIFKECSIPSPCWMCHRKDFDACGAFDSAIYPEDYELCFRFFMQNLKVVSSTEVLHFWRDHPNRTSRNDERYQHNHFISLKIDYLQKIYPLNKKELVIWGAGNKGKLAAIKMLEKRIDFKWVTKNPKKTGKNIYGKIIEDIGIIKKLQNPLVIILVAQLGAKETITDFLESIKLNSNKDYLFFV